VKVTLDLSSVLSVERWILNASGSIAVLVGGLGSDRLSGGLGRDILICGSGSSTLNAGSGGDVLIGGTTSTMPLWRRTGRVEPNGARTERPLMAGPVSVLLRACFVSRDWLISSLDCGAGSAHDRVQDSADGRPIAGALQCRTRMAFRLDGVPAGALDDDILYPPSR
jgi:Ca2+-binding RTX toxin-like protein